MQASAYEARGASVMPRIFPRQMSPALLLTGLLIASLPLENSTYLPLVGSPTRLIGTLAAFTVVFEAMLVVGFRNLSWIHLPPVLFILWSCWTYSWSLNASISAKAFPTEIQLLIFL